MAQIQGKEFSLIIYDSIDISKLTLYCKDNDNHCNYAYILHDKDNKKFHYHLVLQFKKKISLSVVAKLFNIEENLVELIKKSYSACVRYLIHFDDKDKFQYDINSIVSNFDVSSYFNDLCFISDSDILLILIDKCKTLTSLEDILTFAITNNYLSVYRSYYHILKDIYYFSHINEDRY